MGCFSRRYQAISILPWHTYSISSETGFYAMADLDNYDHNHTEVLKQPWDVMLHKVGSRHQFRYFVAACRGLVKGENAIKTISSHILSLHWPEFMLVDLRVNGVE
ncbi:hypothetical protein BDQ17DRAFT_154710 [Cyathus striatus]|nr:hypothetical protein BDQ17DRAFT_154710 [Cyathus striatus]